MRHFLAVAAWFSWFSLFAAGGAGALERLLNLRTAGSPRGYAEAAEAVRREAESGGILQRYVLALVAADENAPSAAKLSEATRIKYLEESRPRIRKLAETKNNALAWYLLSMEKNDSELLKKAADGGNVQALNAWGTMTLTKAMEPSVRSDTNAFAKATREGFLCFRRAATKSDANAFCNLGICYLRGLGCERNAALALAAFRAAAEAGHTEAMNNVGGLYRDGVGTIKSPVKAVRWFAKSAEMGNAYGQLNHALALLRGEGESKDVVRAIELLKASAAQGTAEAMDCLSSCYEKGIGGPPDSMQSLVWMMRARAARGDGPAANWLQKNGYSKR